MRPLFRLLAVLSLSVTLHPSVVVAEPAAIVLDGQRDAGYVLIAEDVAGDLLVGTVPFQWADLTRLYAAHNATHLYIYADLPLYSLTQSVGELGLAVVHPDGAALGPRTDPMAPPDTITYAYTHAQSGGCAPTALAQVRHPDVLIRGEILGEQGSGLDPSTGYTVRATSVLTGWLNTETNWGGLSNPNLPKRIAYASGKGVELEIPWAHLDLDEPAALYLSFFTTGSVAPNLDAIPPDPDAAASAPTTVLSQLVYMALPLPEPLSVAVGCEAVKVAEDGGAANVTVQLNSALTETVAVSYTTSALTASLADFTPVTGTLTFTVGTTRQAIAIPVINDNLVEDDETFVVTLHSPAGVSLAAPQSATVTIMDNDVAGEYALFVPFVRR